MTNSKRLYNCPKKIIGLTGGIASGKTSFSKILQKNGHEIICADSLVKNIYQKKETINFIKREAPASLINGKIIFPKLREIFFSDKLIKINIENFIYSHLEAEFNLELKKIKSEVLIYDVPLLFEKSINTLVDRTVLVYCSKNIQEKRLCERDNISKDSANKIIMSQMPIDSKKEKSDLVIHNTGTFTDLEKQYKKTFLPFYTLLI